MQIRVECSECQKLTAPYNSAGKPRYTCAPSCTARRGHRLRRVLPPKPGLVQHPSGYWVEPKSGMIYSAMTHKPVVVVGTDGYVKTTVGRGHKVVWESVHGPMPHGLVINHLNGIRNDNRIENLECVTQKQNVMHTVKTGRYGPIRRPSAKLTIEDVHRIREQIARGETNLAISSEYGVHEHSIYCIRRGLTWSSV